MDGIEWVLCRWNAEKVAYKFFLFFHHIAQTDPLVHSSGSLETVNRDGNLHVAPQQSFYLMPPYNYEKEEFSVERLVTLAYLILAVWYQIPRLVEKLTCNGNNSKLVLSRIRLSFFAWFMRLWHDMETHTITFLGKNRKAWKLKTFSHHELLCEKNRK